MIGTTVPDPKDAPPIALQRMFPIPKWVYDILWPWPTCQATKTCFTWMTILPTKRFCSEKKHTILHLDYVFGYWLTRICLFWFYVGGYPKCQDCQQSVASLEDAGCGNFQYHFLALPSESTTDLLARYDAWPLLSHFCLARAVLPFAALYPRLGTMPNHANYAGQQLMFPLQS